MSLSLIKFLVSYGLVSRGLAMDVEGPSLEFNSQDLGLAKDSFWEDFQSYSDRQSLLESWIESESVGKDPSTGESTRQYKGQWDVQEPYNLKAFKGDRALTIKNSAVAAMIGRVLPEPIECTADSDLVVQYEVQLQNDLKCGGAFLKLLPVLSPSELRDYAPSSVILELLFGPDMCPPYTDRIHLGIKKSNPYTMAPELKLLREAPLSGLSDTAIVHLYTLILRGSTNEYEIRVDGSVLKAGSLLEEGAFSPGFNPPKYIPDPEEEKPSDWDDREWIPDPKVEKPENWNESEPMMIVDESDKKPEDWDESMPVEVPDAERERPQWWDDAQYGEWIAPIIENPACQEISGCGEWAPTLIENPNYKGPWEPPTIKNPNYQGVWQPQNVVNPQYFEDTAPAKLENQIGAIVFEFWSGTSNLLIDNIYIGKHIEEAELLGNSTFTAKRALQDKQNEQKLETGAKNPKTPPPTAKFDESPNFYDQAIDLIGGYLTLALAKLNVSFSTLVFSIIAILIGVVSLGKQRSQPAKKRDPRKSE